MFVWLPRFRRPVLMRETLIIALCLNAKLVSVFLLQHCKDVVVINLKQMYFEREDASHKTCSPILSDISIANPSHCF